LEGISIATQDTVANATLYAPPLSSTTSLVETFRYHLRSCNIALSPGATNSRVYVIVRKVPAGYTAPAITVTDSVNTFADRPNILAYTIIESTNTLPSVPLRMLFPNVSVMSGESVILQAVSDANNTNLAMNALIEYDISG
jgi:hypothetical protein